MTKKTPRADVYDRVTNQIIDQLEKGIVPWACPWDSGKALAAMSVGLPLNGHTGKRYSGINILLLWGAAADGGFSINRWLTFKQAKALGGHVKKDEKSTPIVYADTFTPKDERERAAADGEEARRVGFLKSYNVFNVTQCDGLPPALYLEDAPLPEREAIAHADEFIKNTGADFRTGGPKAFYVPSLDYIQVPPQTAFRNQIDYYRTCFHELGHWTGAKKRCDRQLTGSFGSHAYAFEELVAEMSAAFTCAAQGIVPTVRHADYIGSWLGVLKNDKRAVFRAARLATTACDYLHSFQIEKAPEEEAA